MRILYVTANAYPFVDANAKIALRLAGEMNRLGHQVELLAAAQLMPPAPTMCLNGVTVHLLIPAWTRLDHRFKQDQSRPHKRLHHLANCTRHPGWTLAFSARKAKTADRMVQRLEWLHGMRTLACQAPWDAVLVQCQPYLAWELAVPAFERLPLYLHQLDPFADSMHCPPYPRAEALRRERRALAAARHIFTTHLLLAAGETGELGGFLSKATAVEFPCLVSPPASRPPSPFPPGNALRLVYTGVLNDQYRSPARLLELCALAQQREPRLELHIFGANQSDCLRAALRQAPPWLHYHGQVPPEQALAATLAADALVNLGNTFANMMPSKILDYLATGLPIVNLCQLADCPTLRLTRRYPAALDLFEGGDVQADALRLLQFLQTHAGRQLAFDQVEALFPQATPAYVAQQMLDVLQSHKEKHT